MPTNKHKRKAASHAKSKRIKDVQPTGLIASHPKAFIYIGLFFVALGIYLLTFGGRDNAMFGLAMLALIVGVVITIYANFSTPNKKQVKSPTR